ncbi:hypothetical protein KY362_07670 [Candidatus Woesearchaeota archaeon]|nr:hypothetical protein [Candidatus Woesearchaeota archaeon]
MRLENIVRQLVPVIVSAAVAFASTARAEERPAPARPCPEQGADFDRDNYLLLLRKYHLPSGTDEVRDRELRCLGLTEFPEHITKHYNRYARKGHRVPPLKRADAVDEIVAKTAPLAPPAPAPAKPPAAPPVVPPTPPPTATRSVDKIVKSAPRAAAKTDDLIVIRYGDESWRLGTVDVARINEYIESHSGAKCFILEGGASEDRPEHYAMKRAGGVRTYMQDVYGLKARVIVRPYDPEKGAKLPPAKRRRTVIRVCE